MKKIEGFEDVVKLLSDLPVTYYPAILISIVTISYKKGVFQNGGASRIIRRVEEKLGKGD
jgi:hypothetical protein